MPRGRPAIRTSDPHEYKELKIGQIWRDRDIRNNGRTLTILAIGPDYALCLSSFGRKVRIRKDRFVPSSTGYDLIKDVK
jgi:hypothetical protein